MKYIIYMENIIYIIFSIGIYMFSVEENKGESENV